MNKRLVSVGVAGGLAALAGTGIVLALPGVSGAQTTTDPSTTTVAPSTTPDAGTPPAERGAWMTDALAPLVTAGTITQAQADAVIAALDAAKPARGPGHGPGHHGRGGPGRGLDAAATALGMTVDELRTALQGGQTIAQVAQSKGVDVQVVIDAMVADVKTRLDAKVAAGEITQAEADTKLAEATERITERVNSAAPTPPAPPTTAPAA